MIRPQILHFLELGGEMGLMGLGFTDMTASMNPQTETVQFINDKNSSEFVKGFGTKWTYNARVMSKQEAIELEREEEWATLEKVYKVGVEQKLGEDATGTLYTVYLDDESSTPTSAYCTAITVNIIPENPGSGAAGESVVFTGSLVQQGDLEKGTFDVSSKTYTKSS